MMPLEWAVVGNPENRRVRLFQEALARQGQGRAIELSYLDLLDARVSLEQLPRGAFLRIDSPGENFAVEQRLLAIGQTAAEQEGAPVLSRREIAALAEDRGLILYPRQWYLGFCRLLERWGQCLAERPDVRSMSCPHEIATMFDKIASHAACRAAEVPVPASLGAVLNFDELLERMREFSLRRVFIKLAHGSSASGVVAFYHDRDRFEAVTSAELVRREGKPSLYNSLKIRRYTRLADVRDLIDALVPHRVQVEQWLPKASLDGRIFDLRVLMIAGEPRHRVVRTSRSPITNLHLGNRRGDSEKLNSRLNEAQRHGIDATCRQAAACFPRSLHVGLDIVLEPGLQRHSVLEVNAFGDLLPRVYHAAQDTYEAQIAAWMARLAV